MSQVMWRLARQSLPLALKEQVSRSQHNPADHMKKSIQIIQNLEMCNSSNNSISKTNNLKATMKLKTIHSTCTKDLCTSYIRYN